MSRSVGRRPAVAWQIGRIALGGSKHQAFLDHRWVDVLLRLAPKRRRRSLALRILSLSPHYFIYQWERYPADWSRGRVLEAENERNRLSRRQIAHEILAPQIAADATVLDFGCGPGYLAAEVAAFAANVIGVDVSAGTLACARVLNCGPTYRINGDGRVPLPDATIDVVYSIAVFQHLDPAAWPAWFAEFARVMRPGAHGFCHLVVAEDDPVTFDEPAGLRGRYSLRFEEHSSTSIASALSDAGFADIRVTPIAAVSTIDDDVGRQHIATFCKPG